MYCRASLVCIWLFRSVNQKQKITSIAIVTVTSPIVINAPTRDLLVIETKGSFVLRWANLNNKPNCSSMFVNSEYSYYDAVLQWKTSLRLFYCQVYARKTICLFALSVHVCQNNDQNHVTVDTLPCDTSPMWKISQLFWSTSWISPSLPQNNPYLNSFHCALSTEIFIFLNPFW